MQNHYSSWSFGGFGRIGQIDLKVQCTRFPKAWFRKVSLHVPKNPSAFPVPRLPSYCKSLMCFVQIELCVHQSKSIRSIPHHFLLLLYKVDFQHTGTNIIQSLKKTSLCLCIFWLHLTSEGCKPRDCRRRGACGEPPETSKSHTLSERVATQGLSKSAAERHLREYASVPWLFGKTRKPFHNMRWIFPQINMLAHHVHVESVKDPISPSFIILAVNCIRVAILFSSRITIM